MVIEIINKRQRNEFIRVDVRFTDGDYDEIRTFDGYNWEQIKVAIERHISFIVNTRTEINRVPEGELVVDYVDNQPVVSDEVVVDIEAEEQPVVDVTEQLEKPAEQTELMVV